MDKDWKDAFAGLLGIFLTFPAIIYTAWLTSYVWKWYAVPLGAFPLTTMQVVGIHLIYVMFTYKPAKESKTGYELLTHLLESAVGHTLCFGLAYLFTLIY